MSHVLARARAGDKTKKLIEAANRGSGLMGFSFVQVEGTTRVLEVPRLGCLMAQNATGLVSGSKS
jgi:hypothetical protein